MREVCRQQGAEVAAKKFARRAKNKVLLQGITRADVYGGFFLSIPVEA